MLDQSPLFVLSLDFELRWGVHDVYGVDISGYRENLEQERYAAPALLELLAQYDTRATWATVGAIGCESWDEYFARAPAAPLIDRRALRGNEATTFVRTRREQRVKSGRARRDRRCSRRAPLRG